MTRPPLLAASTDRTLPTKHVGQLEPNWWCRGWNSKRVKYCRARAGAGTSHSGVGRCRHHGGLKRGGDARVTTGGNSQVKTTTLGQLIDAERKRADPLDLSGELATLRAVFAEFRTRNADVVDHDAATRLLDAIGRMVERIERIRSQNAISRPELNRILHQVWASIDARVRDDNVKADIRDDILRIAL